MSRRQNYSSWLRTYLDNKDLFEKWEAILEEEELPANDWDMALTDQHFVALNKQPWEEQLAEIHGAMKPAVYGGLVPTEHLVPGERLVGWVAGLDENLAKVLGIGRVIQGPMDFKEELRIRQPRDGGSAVEYITHRLCDGFSIWLSSNIHTGYQLDSEIALQYSPEQLDEVGFDESTGAIPGLIDRLPVVIKAITAENELKPSYDVGVAMELLPIVEAIYDYHRFTDDGQVQ